MSSKRDWAKINKDLINRGSLTIYFDEKVLLNWTPKYGKKARGGQKRYTDGVILLSQILRTRFRLSLRQGQGFLNSILSLFQQPICSPNYTTVSRRTSKISLPIELCKKSSKPITVLIDSTGLKMYGPRQWHAKRGGRCKWIKLHLAVDAKTQEIVASTITSGNTADCSVAYDLLKKIQIPVKHVIADGAYDSSILRKSLYDKGITLCSPPQYNARLQSELLFTPVNPERIGRHMAQRDLDIASIRLSSKREWAIRSGYSRRSLVETAMSRFKGAFGDSLSARNPKNIEREIEIKIELLNRLHQQFLRVESV